MTVCGTAAIRDKKQDEVQDTMEELIDELTAEGDGEALLLQPLGP